MNQSLHYNSFINAIRLLEDYDNRITSCIKNIIYKYSENKLDKSLLFIELRELLNDFTKDLTLIDFQRGKIEIPENLHSFMMRLSNSSNKSFERDSNLSLLKESDIYLSFLSQFFKKNDILLLSSEIMKVISILEKPEFTTLTCQDECTLVISKLNKYSILLNTAALDMDIFGGLPVEPPYGLKDQETPQVSKKSLLVSIMYSLSEIDSICDNKKSIIRLIKLVNNDYRIQVGSKCFDFIDQPEWKGWIYRSNPSEKTFKDLNIYELPGIISGFIHDMKQAICFCEKRNIGLKDALNLARKERAVTIELNIQAYHSWPKEERSFRTIKSRYLKPLITGISVVTLILCMIGYFSRNHVLAPLQFIDTAITWLLFLLVAYLIYLCVYGLIGKGGIYTVNKKDLLEIKGIILSEHFTFKSDILENNDYKNCKDISEIDNWLTYCTLFICNLSQKRKAELVQKLGLQEILSHEISLLNFLLPLIKKTERTDEETAILKDIFPLQLIIIPAVNDPHVVELVNHKIRKANYPNIVYLLALEERDKNTVKIVEDAQKNNRFEGKVYTYFGPIELFNAPGTQHKPRNKPKNVNKTLSHFLAGIYELADNGFEKIPKPDYFMIWDLEDDPGEAQIWSMIIANTIIKTTCSDILDLFFKDENHKLKLNEKNFKHTQPKIYENVKRFGIDLNLLLKLVKKYRKSTLLFEKKFSDVKEKEDKLISLISIKADNIVLENIHRQTMEYKHRIFPGHHEYIKVLQSKQTKLYQKYSSERSFVSEEFNRRMMPADTQGILVARMYGDSSMSHLEWVMWFELILPGLMRFRYDYTIFAGTLCGFILGAFTGGFNFAVLFSVAGALIGSFLGFLLRKSGIDLRNKVGLSFSAGTTNNFNFDVLTDVISLYPEYNVAEDWSIALRLAKMDYRSLLINGYNTPTYEDSLAPLGPRMWAQHSRWVGGHFQSFPQVFVSIKKIFQEFGLANWLHSLVNIVILSLAPIFTAYVILKSLAALFIYTIYNILPTYYETDLLKSMSAAKLFLWKLAWWIPNDNYTGIILLVAGPIILILLGSIPIIFYRTDDKNMIRKSIDDLKRQLKELQNNKNLDIQKLKSEIESLRILSDKINASSDKDSQQLILEQLKRDIIAAHASYKLKLVKGFWDDKTNQGLLNRIIRKNGINSAEILFSIAEKLNLKLDSEVNSRIEKLQKRINRLEKGTINIGRFSIILGQYSYALLLKLLMNLGMIYYYLHSTMAVIMYFGQINKNMDSMWRQTGHRLYGTGFSGKIKNEFKTISKNYIKD